jgi:hypothetical protein
VPPVALRSRLSEPRRSVLVAFIQGVVRAGHEHLPPLHEAGGKKARDRAKDDFLGEGGAHGCFYEAEAVPSQGCALEIPRQSFALEIPIPNSQIPGNSQMLNGKMSIARPPLIIGI